VPIFVTCTLAILESGAYAGGLFGCHDGLLCTTGKLLDSIKADDKISNAVTVGL